MKILYSSLIVFLASINVVIVIAHRETLVDYVRSVLNDPAFYALDFEEQYDIIAFIQVALEHHLRIVQLEEKEKEIEKEDKEQLKTIKNKIDEIDDLIEETYDDGDSNENNDDEIV